MPTNANGAINKIGKKSPVAGVATAVKPAPANGIEEPVPPPTPVTVELRARVKGEVFIRLRVLDPRYSAARIVRMLNEGNTTWNVENAARYHRIQKNGKVIAEIEYADEDTYWEHYEAE
jgi:hypothetical protein